MTTSSNHWNKRLLHKAARIWGVQPSYLNTEKTYSYADPLGIIDVLSALSEWEIRTDKDLEFLISKRRENLFSAGAEPSQTIWYREPSYFTFYLPEKIAENRKAKLLISGESFEFSQNFTSNNWKTLRIHKVSPQFVKLQIPIPQNIPFGYFNVTLQVDHREIYIFLISSPSQIPTTFGQIPQKSWGFFAPLYAIRTQSDWGVASYKDLKNVGNWSSEKGSSWLGTLPLLAGLYEKSEDPMSPYSAMTKIFWNELYLDVEELIQKYQINSLKKALKDSSFINNWQNLRQLSHVDYLKVYHLKRPFLQKLSQHFFKKNGESQEKYLIWKSQNPEADAYAQFRAAKTPPEVFQMSSSWTLEKEVKYHLFCQYETSSQIQNLNSSKWGLYLDYPVGVLSQGFDANYYKDSFFQTVTVGAPPEPIFRLGQDWNMPALHPQRIRENHYNYFRRTIVNHMRHCQILRLDHVMGLHRIYCIPKGRSGKEGVYIRYKPDDMFGIVTLEAARHNVDVIGENLGTVPWTVQNQLDKRNWKGMWVFQFSAEENPYELQVHPKALSCVNTHDTPPFSRFLKTTDLDYLHSLGILPLNIRDYFKENRKQGIYRWFKYFQNNFDLEDSENNFYFHVLSYLARLPAPYVVVNIEDLWKEQEFQNIPGTDREVPNWKRKFSVLFEHWQLDSRINKAVKILAQYRPNP